MSDTVEHTLAAVRKAVVEGEYAQLASLVPALEQGASELRRGDLSTLHSLKAEAERTAACLQSALSGVRAARRRVAEITEAAQGLTIYDREGIKATVPVATPASRRV